MSFVFSLKTFVSLFVFSAKNEISLKTLGNVVILTQYGYHSGCRVGYQAFFLRDSVRAMAKNTAVNSQHIVLQNVRSLAKNYDEFRI